MWRWLTHPSSSVPWFTALDLRLGVRVLVTAPWDDSQGGSVWWWRRYCPRWLWRLCSQLLHKMWSVENSPQPHCQCYCWWKWQWCPLPTPTSWCAFPLHHTAEGTCWFSEDSGPATWYHKEQKPGGMFGAPASPSWGRKEHLSLYIWKSVGGVYLLGSLGPFAQGS